MLLGTQGFLSAQEYEFPDKIDDNFVFFKSIDNKIHVLNRSTDYVFEKGKWTKNKLKSKSSKRDSLILFHKKGFNNANFKVSRLKKYLFGFNGGGPVLQLKNDSIIRIDNSVEQKNQFGAASFSTKTRCICTEAMECGLLKTIPHIMIFHQISGSFLELNHKNNLTRVGSQFLI